MYRPQNAHDDHEGSVDRTVGGAHGRAAAVFLGDGGTPFLLGVLAKTGGGTWLFCGDFVVDCW